jgi:hypothetical protein
LNTALVVIGRGERVMSMLLSLLKEQQLTCVGLGWSLSGWVGISHGNMGGLLIFVVYVLRLNQLFVELVFLLR